MVKKVISCAVGVWVVVLVGLMSVHVRESRHDAMSSVLVRYPPPEQMSPLVQGEFQKLTSLAADACGTRAAFGLSTSDCFWLAEQSFVQTARDSSHLEWRVEFLKGFRQGS